MITLVALGGESFVWSAADWYELRKKHRVCGTLVGTFGMLPHQDNILALPLALSPEETILLVEEKIARLVEYNELLDKPNGDLKEKFEEFRRQSYLDQVKFFQEERQRKINGMVDIIVEGKRRKLMGLVTKKSKRRKLGPSSSVEVGPSQIEGIELPDRESIIKNELNKVVPISEDISLVQVPTESPFLNYLQAEDIDSFAPTEGINKLRVKAFAALWHRGYYVTSGQKFGGDFLVYPGDPMKFHAQYIVMCRLPDESFSALSLISLCRVGASVKKSILLATFADGNEDEVKFETISWLT